MGKNVDGSTMISSPPMNFVLCWWWGGGAHLPCLHMMGCVHLSLWPGGEMEELIIGDSAVADGWGAPDKLFHDCHSFRDCANAQALSHHASRQWKMTPVCITTLRAIERHFEKCCCQHLACCTRPTTLWPWGFGASCSSTCLTVALTFPPAGNSPKSFLYLYAKSRIVSCRHMLWLTWDTVYYVFELCTVHFSTSEENSSPGGLDSCFVIFRSCESNGFASGNNFLNFHAVNI